MLLLQLLYLRDEGLMQRVDPLVRLLQDAILLPHQGLLEAGLDAWVCEPRPVQPWGLLGPLCSLIRLELQDCPDWPVVLPQGVGDGVREDA